MHYFQGVEIRKGRIKKIQFMISFGLLGRSCGALNPSLIKGHETEDIKMKLYTNSVNVFHNLMMLKVEHTGDIDGC